MTELMKAMVSLGALGLASAMTGTPAAAQSIGAVTGDQLEAALNEAGLGASMMEDAASGAPVASGQAGQFTFFVRALDCSGTPAACENLMFFANFELGRAASAKDFRIVNDFNDSHVFGRAYVLEARNEVGVDYVIDLGGGVSEDHLSQNISRWADVIGAFVSQFREGHQAS